MGGGGGAPRGEGQARAGAATGGASESAATAHALSPAALSQPEAEAGVAAAFAEEPGAECADLGRTAAAAVPGSSALAGTGALRYPVDASTRDQRSAVPARRVGGL